VSELRNHPLKLTLLAFALAGLAVVAIAAAFGFAAFADAWKDLHPSWLALTVGAELLAMPAYAIAYRVLARIDDGPQLPLALVMRVVVAGFGPFAAGGGFALDKRVLHATENDERQATVRVLGLGALEWALLAPAAWVSAVALLVRGHPRAMPSLLWPWALVVPIGFALGLWLAAPGRSERIAGEEHGKLRAAFGRALRGVGILHSLVRDPQCFVAVVGAALYWTLDIASFYGAIRFIGLQPNIGETILAYATGYALTRRSMPLGGAGATEALMTFSLHWVGQPVPSALAAVVVYRVFNFVLPSVPALMVRPHIKPLLDAADGEGALPHPARKYAPASAGGR
jgi:uncharacterized membrane protein YbhN (UPF0104 family)